MSSPRRSTRSPARTRGRPKSPARTKTAARSRSRSSGRNPKSTVSEIPDLEETKIIRKLPTRIVRSTSPSKTSEKEGTVTRRTVTSTVFSSVSLAASSSAQDQTLVTPLKKSSLISSLIEKEKLESQRQREQLKLEMLSHISTPPSKASDKMESKRPHYEFMGPFGAFFLIILFPVVLYYANCVSLKDKLSFHFPSCRLASLFEVEAILVILAWFFFQVFLAVLPVGRIVEGQTLKSGIQLKYRCNGFLALVVSLLLLGVAVYFQLPVTKVVNNYHKLMTAAFIFSFMLSVSLYIKSSLVGEQRLSPGGNSGNIIYDFFIGRELNPRIGMLDLKFFFKLRPGVIGWTVVDWIMLVTACHEASAFPSNLVLITLFQTLYVADTFWFEDAFLSTVEIVHDGLGFMTLFHGIVWVPFFYSIQTRFILENSYTLSWYCLTIIAVIYFVGFFIYRLSQIQRCRFQRNPNDPTFSGLESLPTQTSERLLVSGWWGMCRKPNYLGDIIIAFSWSLITGFDSFVTYFYPIYLLLYLIYQERRDSERCRKKYGAIWDRYCERVKYRIFPYIY